NPQIDGVFSIDDETSIGVLQAIKEAERKDIKAVTGGGGCQEYFKMMPLYKDIYVQSALYSPSMVITAVNAAYDLACGKNVEKQIIIPTTIVDRDNCAEFLDANSPY
ncbi:MAG: sugar ABC transporter substrate-binding protein, partial [Lentisphaeria bacterium]|nr:sugar ABC transporter substrate-binding protein [Lentisphaeria bacterium]